MPANPWFLVKQGVPRGEWVFESEEFMSTMVKSQVILRGVTQDTLGRVVRECMEFCEWQRWVPRGGSVVLKPNLCTAVPEQIEASNTKLEVIAAVCEVLRERTDRISVVEADH